ncbi:amino acid ABC transporter substrate-binding protein [Pseudomonas sp. MAFF 212408]|uniref:Amino acid ABC transporter substrate-binding protein n=1 Tax=Pseudomonas kitaguniensis TaxID=2607908 RepID=A0A5N7KP68_9PSED|nr:amino acid ABC transporter substrate-binding protein [Pseudomonas kitaguniensis]MPR03820.1 amino acid ABC transporter substrate-binding protein [Pseudomonas kitaguniensis]
MKLQGALFLSLCVLSAGVVANEAVLNKIRENKQLVIGYPTEALPFSYQALAGEPVGYSIDLCRRIANDLKQSLKLDELALSFKPLRFKDRIAAVSSGAVDLECGSTTNTPERQKQVDFSVSTFAASIKVVSRVGEKLDTLQQLNGRSVVIVDGTTVGEVVKQLEERKGWNLKKVHARNLTEGFKLLVDNQADSLVFDEVVVAPLMAGAAEPARYQFLQDVLVVEHLALIMPKNNPGLKRMVDTTLTGLMASGEAKTLYVKWFESPIVAKTLNLNVPFSAQMKQMFSAPTDQPGKAL